MLLALKLCWVPETSNFGRKTLDVEVLQLQTGSLSCIACSRLKVGFWKGGREGDIDQAAWQKGCIKHHAHMTRLQRVWLRKVILVIFFEPYLDYCDLWWLILASIEDLRHSDIFVIYLGHHHLYLTRHILSKMEFQG